MADLRIGASGPLITAAKDAGIAVMAGHAVTLADGNHRVARVEISAVNEGATQITGDTVHIDHHAHELGFGPPASRLREHRSRVGGGSVGHPE